MKNKVFFAILALQPLFSMHENSDIDFNFGNRSMDHNNTTTAAKAKAVSFAKGEDLLIDSIINYTKTFVGIPYEWGGEDMDGFDCSGLFHYVYMKFGYKIPRVSRDQMKMGKPITLDQAKEGDFLFFKGTNLDDNTVKHVSMVVGKEDNSLVILHATRRGIVIDKLEDIAYYRRRYLKGVRPDFLSTNQIALENVVGSKLHKGFLR